MKNPPFIEVFAQALASSAGLAKAVAEFKAGHRATERPPRVRAKRKRFRPLTDDMTNWQRNQWARAGYPMSRRGEFAAMVRPHDR